LATLGCSGCCAAGGAGCDLLLRELQVLGCWAGWSRIGSLGIKVLGILERIQINRIQTLNLNSNKQKQCTSMYAIFNSYDSLILF
jgi:hypothetical protein